MGAEVIISGLQDAVVKTLIDLGMTLDNIQAVLDLDDALALSRADQQDGKYSIGIETPDEQVDEYHSGYRSTGLSASYADSLFAGSSFAGIAEV